MRDFTRVFFGVAIIGGILLPFAPEAHAAGTPEVNIQMLPPTPLGSPTPCGTGANQILVYSGNGSGQSGINCLAGVTGSDGTLTTPSFSSTTINSTTISNSGNVTTNTLTVGAINTSDLQITNGSSVTDVTNATVNIANMPACNSNQAMTASGRGVFNCIAIADIPNIGTAKIPSCNTAANQELYFDTTNGFSCVVNPIPLPISCTGSNSLQFDTASNAWICQPLPASTDVTCPAGEVVIGAGGNSTTCSGNFVSNVATGDVTAQGQIDANQIGIGPGFTAAWINNRGEGNFAGGLTHINYDGSVSIANSAVWFNASGQGNMEYLTIPNTWGTGDQVNINGNQVWNSGGPLYLNANGQTVSVGTSGTNGGMKVWGPLSATNGLFSVNGALFNNTTTVAPTGSTGLGGIILNIDGSATFANGSIVIENNGSMYVSGGTLVSSDIRLKKDVHEVNEGLGTIMNLKPVTWVWKDEGKNDALVNDPNQTARKYGFVAQDVEKVLPDLVHNASFGGKPETLTLDYNGIIAPLVKAVQEQQAEIDDLKAEVARLKAQ